MKMQKETPSVSAIFYCKSGKQRHRIAFNASPKPNGGRFRELFTGEAGVLVPATAAVLPGLGLWPSAHPFGRRGAPAFR